MTEVKAITEVRPLHAPAAALRLEIDDPSDRRLTKPSGAIHGWFASSEPEMPDDFDLRLGGLSMRHVVARRLDVEAAMPEYLVVGFTVPYDLSDFLPYITDNRLHFVITVAGYEPHRLRFTITDDALSACLASAGE